MHIWKHDNRTWAFEVFEFQTSFSTSFGGFQNLECREAMDFPQDKYDQQWFWGSWMVMDGLRFSADDFGKTRHFAVLKLARLFLLKDRGILCLHRASCMLSSSTDGIIKKYRIEPKQVPPHPENCLISTWKPNLPKLQPGCNNHHAHRSSQLLGFHLSF